MLKNTAIVATLLCTALSANAGTLNWNKYRASYVSVDSHEDKYSADGFALSATRMIDENLFGTLQSTLIQYDDIIDGIEAKTETINFDGVIGIKHTYHETTDIYGSIGFKYYHNDFLAEYNDRTKNDIGYSATIGVKSIFHNALELHVNSSRVVFHGDGRWEHLIGVAYHINRNFSYEASFVKTNYANKFVVGASFGF
ncbi:MAG: hypothetical protein ACJA0H_000310 [Francisellaceae bacterium]|jgi:hypothetical protein